jgi:3-hydroxymyristoyl/3-hydroxydecanoyl-(acyl carrier protein) dehydratase
VRPEEEIALRAEKLAQVGDLWQFSVEARVRGELVAAGQLVLSLARESSSARLE